MTSVVRLPAIVGEEAHCIARGDELGILCGEFLDRVPERWNRFAVLVERHGEPYLAALAACWVAVRVM